MMLVSYANTQYYIYWLQLVRETNGSDTCGNTGLETIHDDFQIGTDGFVLALWEPFFQSKQNNGGTKFSDNNEYIRIYIDTKQTTQLIETTVKKILRRESFKTSPAIYLNSG